MSSFIYEGWGRLGQNSELTTILISVPLRYDLHLKNFKFVTLKSPEVALTPGIVKHIPPSQI
jgi:hypothetical protein